MTINSFDPLKLVPDSDEKRYSSSGILVVFNIVALIVLIGVYFAAKSKKTQRINLKNIRQMYEGLPPDESD